jgi:hypothetical protein
LWEYEWSWETLCLKWSKPDTERQIIHVCPYL